MGKAWPKPARPPSPMVFDDIPTEERYVTVEELVQGMDERRIDRVSNQGAFGCGLEDTGPPFGYESGGPFADPYLSDFTFPAYGQPAMKNEVHTPRYEFASSNALPQPPPAPVESGPASNGAVGVYVSTFTAPAPPARRFENSERDAREDAFEKARREQREMYKKKEEERAKREAKQTEIRVNRNKRAFQEDLIRLLASNEAAKAVQPPVVLPQPPVESPKPRAKVARGRVQKAGGGRVKREPQEAAHFVPYGVNVHQSTAFFDHQQPPQYSAPSFAVSSDVSSAHLMPSCSSSYYVPCNFPYFPEMGAQQPWAYDPNCYQWAPQPPVWPPAGVEQHVEQEQLVFTDLDSGKQGSVVRYETEWNEFIKFEQ
ncbi:hypothetical protein M3Y99_01650000 [Aphelenchoides fujianensis]|nr:hypothetical protein M3Y99_01650000 [Aphelenchoides fujianensis]